MRHTKGIPGIKAFLNDKAREPGWHLFTDNNYRGYEEERNVFEISHMIGDEYVLLGWTGNAVHFVKDDK